MYFAMVANKNSFVSRPTSIFLGACPCSLKRFFSKTNRDIEKWKTENGTELLSKKPIQRYKTRHTLLFKKI